MAVIANDDARLCRYVVFYFTTDPDHSSNFDSLKLVVYADFDLIAAGGEMPTDETALIDDTILDNCTGTNFDIITYYAIFDRAEWRDDDIITDACSRQNTYVGAYITIFSDNSRPDDIRIGANYGASAYRYDTFYGGASLYRSTQTRLNLVQDGIVQP